METRDDGVQFKTNARAEDGMKRKNRRPVPILERGFRLMLWHPISCGIFVNIPQHIVPRTRTGIPQIGNGKRCVISLNNLLIGFLDSNLYSMPGLSEKFPAKTPLTSAAYPTDS